MQAIVLEINFPFVMLVSRVHPQEQSTLGRESESYLHSHL